ncbi:MAG: molybdopterin-dependent oxidoreductase [Planctomycetota bacterium]|jgi:sulfite oxidase
MKEQRSRIVAPPPYAGAIVLLLAPLFLNTPARALEPPPITSIDDFFTLGAAPEVPQNWTLTVDGQVDNPLSLTLREIKNYPAVTEMSTLECYLPVGDDPFKAAKILPHSKLAKINTYSSQSRSGGLLVSNANWTGVRLNDILAQARLRTSARSITFTALDGYQLSYLLDELTTRDDILLAYEMNGQTLPPIQGYPIKLVLPGIAGYQNVRWLKRITVSDGTFAASLIHYDVHARILQPLRLTTHPVGTQTISGMAFAGLGKEGEKVDISIDHGQTWLPTEILSYYVPNVWKHWKADIEITRPGSYKVFARAQDTIGNVQLSGIGNFGWEGFGVPFDVDYDDDTDEVANAIDNCPALFNPAQTDSDADGLGNACDPKCPNLDQLNPVSIADLALLAQNWGLTEPNTIGDLNADNLVDANDLQILTLHWLADCYE